MVMGTRMTDWEQKIATGKWMVRLYLRVVRVCLIKTMSLVHGLVSPILSLVGQGPAVDQRPHQDYLRGLRVRLEQRLGNDMPSPSFLSLSIFAARGLL